MRNLVRLEGMPALNWLLERKARRDMPQVASPGLSLLEGVKRG
ncbi:MAG: hypothetical protein AB7W28_04295 [Armatimonadota bacterium]